MVFFIDVVFALVMVTFGAVAGWFLRRRSVPAVAPAPNDASEDFERAREVLAQLHEVAAKVAADVGDHSSRVEEINEELVSVSEEGTTAVVGVVAKLVEANKHMQERLASAEEKLEEQNRLIEWHAAEARTDGLTGLANRRALDDAMALRVAEFQRCGRGFSVVMFDVDHFKKLNDTYGHQAGDEVLRRLGQLLRKTAREMDFVARYGGEEFCLLFPGASVEEAVRGAERLRRAIGESTFRFEGVELPVSVSIGVAQLRTGEDGPTVLKRSDEALYAAKSGGRNCTYWHDGKETFPASALPPPAPPAKPAPAVAAEPPAAEEDAPETGTNRAKTGMAVAPRNRTAFCVDLGIRVTEWERGGPTLSVLLAKVDKFPEIAATYGEPIAQLVLRTTTQFLTAITRDTAMVAEYDQATFAVQLPGAELATTINIAERLREAVASCGLATERGQLRFTVSIGGSEVMEGDKIERILRRAEESLDSSVRSGGNCAYFHNGRWTETVRAARERLSVLC